MELIRGLHNLRSEHRGCAVTIGNFDGVHRGHQAVLAHLAQHARRLGVPSVLMLFEPQPPEYFRPEEAPPRLMRLREKLLALREQPVDRVLCIRFDARFASLTPDDFIRRVLIDGLDVRYVVVGKDFRFGNKRRGDVAQLRRAAQQYGFEVTTAPTFELDGERVSSTRVRTALAAGDLPAAAKLLGRPYSMCGRVAHGNKLGRRIGIPTANIHLHRHRTPIEGIFVAELSDGGARHVPGAASVGIRPTVGGSQPLLEVHLLDFDADIYGHYVTVNFLQKLRDERRFDSVEEMRLHILQDIDAARRYFNDRREPAPAAATGTVRK